MKTKAARRAGRCERTQEAAHRIAVFLDLENLLHEARAHGELAAARTKLLAWVSRQRRRGVIVSGVACCDAVLAREFAFQLRALGVRVFRHGGGPDAADDVLVRRLRSVPESCDTVLIGSGDHAFADVAAELRARGKRVEVFAPFGSLAWQLSRAADECRTLSLGLP